MSKETGLLPVFGGRIYYELYGKESTGTPLICLHGGPGGTHAGLRVMEKISDERPVLVYDQLGSGLSDKNPDMRFWTVESFVEELAEIRKAFGFDEVFIMGQSWGTILATSYMHYKKPTGVKGLILSGSALSCKRWAEDALEQVKGLGEEHYNAVMEAERTGNFSGPAYEAAEEAYTRKHGCPLLPWPPPPPPDPRLTLNRDIYGHMSGPCEFECLGTLKNMDTSPWLPEFDCPIQFTCGEFDTATPKTTAYYASLCKDARVHVFEGAGHSHLRELPDAYCELVRNFLKECEEK